MTVAITVPHQNQTSAIKAMLLKEGLNTPANEVVEKLRESYPHVNLQNVYTVRNTLRQGKNNTGNNNNLSLREALLQILSESEGTLTSSDLRITLLSGEYGFGNKPDFDNTICKTLRRLYNRKLITLMGKNSSGYNLWIGKGKKKKLEKKPVEQSSFGEIDKMIETYNLSEKMGGFDRLDEFLTAIANVGGVEAIRANIDNIKKMNNQSASELFFTIVKSKNGN